VGPVEDIELKGPEEVAAMKVILLIVALLCLVGTASATDYYVDVNGDNSSNGLTVGTAWQNISYGVAQLTAGDTLYLVNGTWYNETGTFSTSGNITHQITIDRYNGTPMLWGGRDKNKKAFSLQTNDYINIKNISIHNYFGSINLQEGATNVNITNCDISSHWSPGDDSGASAIQLARIRNVTISYCTIYNASWNAITVSGNQSLAIGAKAYDLYVLNNHFENNTGHTGMLDIIGDVENIYIENNTGYYIQDCVFLHQNINGVENLNFINNTINITTSSGVDTKDTYNSTYTDNIFYSMTPSAFWHRPGGLVAETDNNLYFENNTISDSSDASVDLKGESLYLIDNTVEKWFQFATLGTVANVEYTEYVTPQQFQITAQSEMNYTLADNTIYKYERIWSTGEKLATIIEPRWYSTHSNCTITAPDGDSYKYQITMYNITFTPSVGYGHNITVNTDMVDDVSNISANVSTSCTANMEFVVDNGSNTYNLYVDGVWNTTGVSNSDSIVSFDYDFPSSTSTDFEVTWNSTVGWSYNEQGIYQSKRFTVDDNGNYTQQDNPTQEDTNLTGLIEVRVG